MSASRSRDQEKREKRKKKKNASGKQNGLIVYVKEEEAVQVIGPDAGGLTELAQRITNKIKSLGHLVPKEIEILVPKASADGVYRKMLFMNVAQDMWDMALEELLPHVSYCRKDEGPILKDESTIDKEARSGSGGREREGDRTSTTGDVKEEPGVEGRRSRSNSTRRRLAELEKMNPAPDRVDRYESRGKRITKRMEVTVDKIGLLIGRGGSKVKEIQNETGAEVYIDPTDFKYEPPISRVRIIGEEDKVEKAHAILQDILAWAAAHPREEAGKKMEVSLHHVPKVLKIRYESYTTQHPLYNMSKITSKEAVNLKVLEEETGCDEILIDQTTGNQGYATILIRGDDKAMARAVDILTKEYLFKGDNSHLFTEMEAFWMVHPAQWEKYQEEVSAKRAAGIPHASGAYKDAASKGNYYDGGKGVYYDYGKDSMAKYGMLDKGAMFAGKPFYGAKDMYAKDMYGPYGGAPHHKGFGQKGFDKGFPQGPKGFYGNNKGPNPNVFYGKEPKGFFGKEHMKGKPFGKPPGFPDQFAKGGKGFPGKEGIPPAQIMGPPAMPVA